MLLAGRPCVNIHEVLQSLTGGKDSNANPVAAEDAEDEEGGRDEDGKASHRQQVFLRSKMTISEFIATTENVGDEEKKQVEAYHRHETLMRTCDKDTIQLRTWWLRRSKMK